MQIGQTILKIRKEANLSQEEFASEFNVTRQTVSNWENEKTYPDLLTLVKISDMFNYSLDTMLKEDPKMTREMNNSIQNGEKYTKAYKAGLIISAISAVLQFVLFFMWIDTKPIVACIWLVAFVINGVALIFNAKRVKKNETAGCVSFENITHDDRITIQHLTGSNMEAEAVKFVRKRTRASLYEAKLFVEEIKEAQNKILS